MLYIPVNCLTVFRVYTFLTNGKDMFLQMLRMQCMLNTEPEKSALIILIRIQEAQGGNMM